MMDQRPHWPPSPESLRWALMAIMPFAIAVGIAQFAMTSHLEKDLAE